MSNNSWVTEVLVSGINFSLQKILNQLLSLYYFEQFDFADKDMILGETDVFLNLKNFIMAFKFYNYDLFWPISYFFNHCARLIEYYNQKIIQIPK